MKTDNYTSQLQIHDDHKHEKSSALDNVDSGLKKDNVLLEKSSIHFLKRQYELLSQNCMYEVEKCAFDNETECGFEDIKWTKRF